MKTEVAVTPGMIATARLHGIGDKGHCAIVLALVEGHPERTYVKVDKDTIRWTDHGTRIRYVYETPDVAAKFITEFDDPAATPRKFKMALDLDRPLRSTRSEVRPSRSVVKKSTGKPSKLLGRQSNRRTAV